MLLKKPALLLLSRAREETFSETELPALSVNNTHTIQVLSEFRNECNCGAISALTENSNPNNKKSTTEDGRYCECRIAQFLIQVCICFHKGTLNPPESFTQRRAFLFTISGE